MSSISDCLRNLSIAFCLHQLNPLDLHLDQASTIRCEELFQYSLDHQGWGQRLFVSGSFLLYGLVALYQRVRVPSFHLDHQISSKLQTVGIRRRWIYKVKSFYTHMHQGLSGHTLQFFLKCYLDFRPRTDTPYCLSSKANQSYTDPQKSSW